MRELNVNEVQEVNGGVASLIYWTFRGGLYLYRTYSASQLAYGAGAVVGAAVTVEAQAED